MIQELINEARNLAEKYPNNIYTKEGEFCSYSTGKNSQCPERGCILGIASRNIGKPLDRFQSEIQVVLEERLNEDFTAIQENWLIGVQMDQDFGKSWGEAIKKNDEFCLREFGGTP